MPWAEISYSDWSFVPMAAVARAVFFADTDRRADLVERLRNQCRARINRIRKTLGYGSLPNDDLSVSLETAVSLGFYRALINRFSEHEGLDADWWREKRKLHARTAKDRTNDFSIILTYYPQFETFEPAVPVIDREVLVAAEKEFFDLVASPGTEYHAVHMQWYKPARFDDEARPIAVAYLGRKAETRELATQLEVVDPSAQDRVESVFVYDMLDDDRNVFGPGLSRVAALARKHFGRGGLFWLAEWLFYPGRYADVMNVIGPGWKLGDTTAETMKRDMVRKLPVVHQTMMELLRTDPLILRLRDMLYGDNFFSTLPPANEQVDDDPFVQLAREERKVYLARWNARMLEFVKADPFLSPSATHIEEDDGVLVRLFIGAQDRPDRMSGFYKEVRKIRQGV